MQSDMIVPEAKQSVRDLQKFLAIVNNELLNTEYDSDGEITELYTQLTTLLVKLRARLDEFEGLGSETVYRNDPSLGNMRVALLEALGRYSLEVAHDVNPKLERLATKLQTTLASASGEDSTLIQREQTTLNEAIRKIGEPLIKAAALAKAIETFLGFIKGLT